MIAKKGVFQKATDKVKEVVSEIELSKVRKEVYAFNKELIKKKEELNKSREGTGIFDSVWMITDGYEKYIDTMIDKTSKFLSATGYIDVKKAVKKPESVKGAEYLSISLSDLSAHKKMLKELSGHIADLKGLTRITKVEEKVSGIMELVSEKLTERSSRS